jgi:hypothetical protein
MKRERTKIRDFSVEGKTIRVFSDGIMELSDGYYDKSFDNLEKAVKFARELRSIQLKEKK